MVSDAPPPPPPPAPTNFPATIKSIQFQGVSPEAQQELRSRLPFREGDTVSQSDLTNLRSAVQAFDAHFVAGYSLAGAPGGGSDLTVQVRVAAQAASAEATIRQSSGVQAAKIIQNPEPVYPPIARQARIQGTVTLDATIAPDGTVQRLVLLSSSNPLLTPAAMDAVKKWTYQPTILNGQPVTVSTTVDVNFRIQD